MGRGRLCFYMCVRVCDLREICRPLQLPMKHGKYHVTIGNDTVMAKVTFFGAKEMEEKVEGGVWDTQDYATQDHYLDGDEEGKILSQWGIITFDKPLVCKREENIIGSRLDTDEKCRLAWEGSIVESWDGKGKERGGRERTGREGRGRK